MRGMIGALLLALGLFLSPLALGGVRVTHSTTASEEAVRYWAWAYDLSFERLWARATCESSGDPYAQGGDHDGLFQFAPATYDWILRQENADPTLAPRLTSYDPEWRGVDDAQGAASAHLAAWAEAHGYGYLWQCPY